MWQPTFFWWAIDYVIQTVAEYKGYTGKLAEKLARLGEFLSKSNATKNIL